MKDEKLSRMSNRKERKEEKKTIDETKKVSWVQMRILPIYVRVLLVILLLIVVTIIGLRIGYGYMGDGNPNDVLKKETWTHIIDIINGKE